MLISSFSSSISLYPHQNHVRYTPAVTMAPPNSTSPEAGSSPEPSAEISSDMKTSPKKKSSNKALKSPAKRTAKTPARATAKGTDTVKSPVKPMPAWSDEDFKLLWNVLQSTGASVCSSYLSNKKKGMLTFTL